MPERFRLELMPIAVPSDGGRTRGVIGATALKQAAQQLCAQAPQSQDESCTWPFPAGLAAVSDGSTRCVTAPGASATG